MLFYSLSLSSSYTNDGCVFFQAEDGIRDLVRSRGLGDVYKRQENGPSYRKTVEYLVPRDVSLDFCAE